MAIATREVVLASAARTATSTTTLETKGALGCFVYVDVTVDPAAASVVANIDGYDSFADEAWTILDGGAMAAVGFFKYWIYPGATVTANVSANAWLPDKIQINMVHADADSITYSVHVVWLR
jgi:hypothetical protein